MRQGGYTLVELVVGLVLLELLLLGALASMHLGAMMTRRARVVETALWEAGALADSIRAGETDGTARRDRPWGWIERRGRRVEASDSAGHPLVELELPS